MIPPIDFSGFERKQVSGFERKATGRKIFVPVHGLKKKRNMITAIPRPLVPRYRGTAIKNEKIPHNGCDVFQPRGQKSEVGGQSEIF